MDLFAFGLRRFYLILLYGVMLHQTDESHIGRNSSPLLQTHTLSVCVVLGSRKVNVFTLCQPCLCLSFLIVVFVSDQTSLLEFLHILTTNHKLVFAAVNNEPEFIAGLCHWLLVMGTHKSLAINDDRKAKDRKISEGD